MASRTLDQLGAVAANSREVKSKSHRFRAFEKMAKERVLSPSLALSFDSLREASIFASLSLARSLSPSLSRIAHISVSDCTCTMISTSKFQS